MKTKLWGVENAAISSSTERKLQLNSLSSLEVVCDEKQNIASENCSGCAVLYYCTILQTEDPWSENRAKHC